MPKRTDTVEGSLIWIFPNSFIPIRACNSRSEFACGVEGSAFMKEHNYRVYFMASKSRVLYIGVTNNLERRVYEHKHDLADGFSKQYRCHRLMYFESYDRVRNAIAREKQLERWNRAKKIFLIERVNPAWEDISAEWGQPIEKHVHPLAS